MLAFASAGNSQSDHLLYDRLNPCLEHGQLCANTVDGSFSGCLVVQVGLVEHVRVVVEPEKMTGVGVLLYS